MADNKYDPEKLFNDLLHHQWYGDIMRKAYYQKHKIPAGSKIGHEDLVEAGLYALHDAIVKWNEEKHGPFVAYTRKTISGAMSQAIRNNQAVDPYFHDAAKTSFSKQKASEVKDITSEAPQADVPEATKPKLP